MKATAALLWQTESTSRYTKSCIGTYIVRGDRSAVNPQKRGTKASAHYVVSLEPGASAVFDCRLTDAQLIDPFGPDFGATFAPAPARPMNSTPPSSRPIYLKTPAP